MDAIILAGGENKRFPLTKSFLEIDNRRIIETNVELLRSVCKRVMISTNTPELYFYLGIPLVGDIINCRGPMTGIFSVLNLPDVSEVFVIACDMPFIKAKLVKYIIRKWSDKWEAVIPVFDNEPQPLLGVYSKRIAYNMERSIVGGKRGLRYFLMRQKVLYINEEEVRAIDPEGRSFVNINTIEDFQKGIGGKKCLV